MDTNLRIDPALHAAGELLERRRARAAIVVVGGAALNLLGVITRATRDVDVIATATPRPRGHPAKVRRPVLPRTLVEVIATVARDQGLPDARWITRSQDPSAAVGEAVARVIAYVQDGRR